MKVTKYEHAALVVEESGRRLVVDPGSFTRSLGDIADVDAIVVTHEHADHWTPEQLSALLATNPGAKVFGNAGIAAALEGFAVETVADGQTVEVGPFTLTFAGTTHATIHSTVTVPANTGVLVNAKLFYPGDAFFVPPFPVEVLAAPVGAPWLKIGDAMDYVLAVKAARSFPVHEQTLSEAGFAMHSSRLAAMAESFGGSGVVLQAGESLEV
ncbi:MBL fold metallo-hydrolase [Frondihabitans cladoniiphilus]|uniref:MBL fold metallo-hydrolase n=1 Tax=Frondihabitans cladoniiphilus TaxID=715785 RepID=A0ABP8VJK0_9MICO